MPSFEMTRPDLVRAMVEVGYLLTGPKSLEERMNGLCVASTAMLNCDQFAIMQIDGNYYRGVFQFRLPDSLAEFFAQYLVPRDKPIVTELESCNSYLLHNSLSSDPTLRKIAEIVGVQGVIIVPFTHPDGSPLGYLTASYYEDKPLVTTEEAELATGIARIVQTTLLRHIETERRLEVSQAMLEVADSERRRLSRDIHDDSLQRILALRIGLEGFRARLDDPALRDCVDTFVDQCRSASASLREVMLRTHPNAAELADLEEVLNAMVDRQEFGGSAALRFEDHRSHASPIYLVPALNRVAEQAARNTLHHAEASVLSVTLTDKADGTLLTIADDGKGFEPSDVDRTRLGLVSMRERTELLGGTFSIDSLPGAGTVVSAWFPHTEVEELQSASA